MLTATDVSRQFLAGDTLNYGCNGALVPELPLATLRTCVDPGSTEAVWVPDEVATPLPICCKYIYVVIMTKYNFVCGMNYFVNRMLSSCGTF